jgi:hypothetical protein
VMLTMLWYPLAAFRDPHSLIGAACALPASGSSSNQMPAPPRLHVKTLPDSVVAYRDFSNPDSHGPGGRSRYPMSALYWRFEVKRAAGWR